MIPEKDRINIRKIIISPKQALSTHVFILHVDNNELKWHKKTKPNFIGFTDIMYEPWEENELNFFYINFLRNGIDGILGDSIDYIKLTPGKNKIYDNFLNLANPEYYIIYKEKEFNIVYYQSELEYRLDYFKKEHKDFNLINFIGNEDHFTFIKMPCTAYYKHKKHECEIWTLSLISGVNINNNAFKFETYPIKTQIIFH